MKLTVNSQLLAAELRLLNKVIPTKPVIAILSYVLLEAKEGELHFYATDLEIGLKTDCRAEVSEAGSVVLPAARFLALVEQFLDGDVIIEEDKVGVIIRSGGFKTRLRALSEQDFPTAPDVEGTPNTLDAQAFHQLIAKTRHAVIATAQKQILQGALLTLATPAAAMVATDGKRLSLATMAYTGTNVRITIPAKTLDYLLAGQLDGGSVELTVGSRHIFFAIGGRLLISRTLEGQFPGYERIIPRDNNKQMTIERQTFLAALRRVALVAEEKNRGIYLNASPGTLELSAVASGIGSADESVPIGYEGDAIQCSIHAGHLLDFLESATESTVTLALNDPLSPMLLLDGPDHLGVILLMR